MLMLLFCLKELRSTLHLTKLFTFNQIICGQPTSVILADAGICVSAPVSSETHKLNNFKTAMTLVKISLRCTGPLFAPALD